MLALVFQEGEPSGRDAINIPEVAPLFESAVWVARLLKLRVYGTHASTRRQFGSSGWLPSRNIPHPLAERAHVCVCARLSSVSIETKRIYIRYIHIYMFRYLADSSCAFLSSTRVSPKLNFHRLTADWSRGLRLTIPAIALVSVASPPFATSFVTSAPFLVGLDWALGFVDYLGLL